MKNIGKLTQLFSEGRAMGLKNGMLATASVINELAQSSSASEPYLLEFTARLASIGSTAKIAQSDLTAIAAILDQGMVGVEKGATAMQNVLTAIYRRPAKMAKAAGLDVQKFTELVKTDANAALLQFIGALKDARSLENIAPMLEEMKLSGSGVTQTLATLANGLDNLKATQQQAALAFLEHTSATKEAEAANGTVQAQIEKAQKAYKDLAVELGGHLEPVVKHMVSSTALFAKALLYSIRFALEHKRANRHTRSCNRSLYDRTRYYNRVAEKGFGREAAQHRSRQSTSGVAGYQNRRDHGVECCFGAPYLEL